MAPIIESLQVGRIPKFSTCHMYNHAHLNGLGEFRLSLHNANKCILCLHEFVTIMNVQGNPIAK